MIPDTNTKRKGVVLFSGGLDSILATILVASENSELISLSIDYPGRPRGEKAAAEALIKKLPFINSQVVSLVFGESLTVAELIGSKREGWMPYRNLLFWSIAAHKAMIVGADFIVGGHDIDDTEVFADASESFFNELKMILKFNGNEDFPNCPEIVLPLISDNDDFLFNIGRREDVYKLLNTSWSCWRDLETPCGICAACKDREQFLTDIRLTSVHDVA